jgi:hypothetical protein
MNLATAMYTEINFREFETEAESSKHCPGLECVVLRIRPLPTPSRLRGNAQQEGYLYFTFSFS